MKERIIVPNKDYSDCFVAMRTFKSKRVIAHGKNATTVRKKAIDKGAKNPVVIYIPPKNCVCLY